MRDARQRLVADREALAGAALRLLGEDSGKLQDISRVNPQECKWILEPEWPFDTDREYYFFKLLIQKCLPW